ncbi:MAG: hypothetical protein ABTQ25_19300 [Nitrosomonas ureae]
MTYVAKSPFLTTQGIGNQSIAVWYHSSADAGAAVDTDGFWTDAVVMGAKVGDLFIHRDTGTDIVTTHVVKSLGAATANLTDTTTTGSGTVGD